MKSLLLLIAMIISWHSFGAKITDNELIVGDPNNAANIDIKNPNGQNILRINDSTNVWEFSNDSGSNFSEIGSGSGSGGGANSNNAFGSNDNANAEKGTTGWSETGGTFGVTTTDPLEGKQSFTWTPTAQNEYVQGPSLSVDKDIFRGRLCMARIEYIGGDENLTLRIIDGGGSVFAEKELKAKPLSSGPESVRFFCPTATDIAGNADLGSLRIRIANTGASASPLIKWDKSYLGTQDDVETQDVKFIEEKILSSDQSASGDITDFTFTGLEVGRRYQVKGQIWQNNGSGNSTDIQMYSGPGATGTLYGRIRSSYSGGSVGAINSGSFVATSNTLYFNYTDGGASADIKGDGTKLESFVQLEYFAPQRIFTSIPKLSENENSFTAKINSDGTIDYQVPDNWITAPCTSVGGTFNCDISPLNASEKLLCTITGLATGNITGSYDYNNSTTTNLRYRTFNAGSASSADAVVKCDKSEADIRNAVEQPIVVGQVENSYASSTGKPMAVESCHTLLDGGTPIADYESCDSWIDSYTDNGVGDITYNLKAGVFSGNVSCTCSSEGGQLCRLPSVSATQVNLEINSDFVGGGTDRDHFIICQGEK